MILDERALFSDKQLITATGLSDSSYDLGDTGTTYDGVKLKRSIGKAGMIPFLVQVTEDFDNLTSLAIELQTDGAVDGAGDLVSGNTVMAATIPLASLVAGFHIPGFQQVPRELVERYVQMNYVVTGAAPTVGRITAGVVAGVDGAYQG